VQIGGVSAAASRGETTDVPSPRLVKAAHEFEGQMMQELLKPLTDSDGLTAEDGDSGEGSAGALGSFASEALGQALSRHGGLGIADRVLKELGHTEGQLRSGK
jgi:Rod binding domain-containing protein